MKPQQSNVIFAALLIAFILFITNRGELPTYLTLLRGGGTINSSATQQGILSGLIDEGQTIDNNGVASDIPGVITSLVGS